MQWKDKVYATFFPLTAALDKAMEMIRRSNPSQGMCSTSGYYIVRMVGHVGALLSYVQNSFRRSSVHSETNFKRF